MTKDTNVFLAHARDCCIRIEAYTQEGKQAFFADTKTQDAVLRNLEIIGQCFKDTNLPLLTINHPTVPWRDVAALRNILAHAYLGIELPIVWDIIEHQLQPLRRELDGILLNWTP